MRFVRTAALSALVVLALALTACGGAGPNPPNADPAEPAFSAALFGAGSATITNTHFPLSEGMTRLYQSETDEGMETVVEEVLEGTRTIAGVECARVRAREWLGELLIEDTEDWYAQDTSGNVWYLGEAATNYEYDNDDNLVDTNTDGSWETGQDVAGVGQTAEAGIIMKANPTVGDSYRQEYYPGEAEDMGEIVALSEQVTLDDGATYTCLKTRDWNPLEADSTEFKYYAPGLGLVMEENEDGDEQVHMRAHLDQSALPNPGAATFSNPTQIDNTFFPFVPETVQAYALGGEDEVETVISEVLDTTRIVDGVECVVVRVREFEDDLLLEDTSDWYAQDDAGNVWYFGEAVINYEYDDDGNLIGTDTDGSWEAGIDGAIAGILIPGTPVRGFSSFQEVYEDEAEDMGFVVATGVDYDAGNGVSYAGCLQTLDWTPLEPGVLEYKFYAPGVGLIAELHLDGESDPVELQGGFDVGEDSLPDFSAATFSAPATITNPLLPFAVGSTWEYEADTEDGTETILVEVLATTRTVNGLECAVVRDRVYLEGLLIEDTHDWYAQDDAGNVWYMGEDVVNYEYDDDDNLIGTDNEGAWEAGVDGAEAGIVMWATPLVGPSYRQEYYEDEAEDMAVVIATGVTVTLEDGSVFTGCLKTLEWTPLEPESLEYKYYAAGVGVVVEEKAGSGERVELTGP